MNKRLEHLIIFTPHVFNFYPVCDVDAKLCGDCIISTYDSERVHVAYSTPVAERRIIFVFKANTLFRFSFFFFKWDFAKSGKNKIEENFVKRFTLYHFVSLVTQQIIFFVKSCSIHVQILDINIYLYFCSL